MADKQPTGAASAATTHDEEGHPRGTLLLMLLFLVMIVAMWGYMYLLLLGRG